MPAPSPPALDPPLAGHNITCGVLGEMESNLEQMHVLGMSTKFVARAEKHDIEEKRERTL